MYIDFIFYSFLPIANEMMFIVSRSFCNGSEMSNYANALKSLDTILKSYDARNIPRPQSGNGNVTVETNFFLRDILEVDERNMVRLMLSSEVLITILIPERTVLDICVKSIFSGIQSTNDVSTKVVGQAVSVRQ